MNSNNDIEVTAASKAQQWLELNIDEDTRNSISNMLNADDKTELINSFYKNLEFGTGGIRGIMGAGTNRMNIYTVGTSTQGFANYINKSFPAKQDNSVCIGHDCRHNSRLFAETVANIFSANGIKAYLFEDLRPTPEMSFCIRHLGCVAGVIITASHNPKEYNGYKAYWNDGSQLVPPHDRNVIDEIGKVGINDIKFTPDNNLIEILDSSIDEIYLDTVKTLSFAPDAIKRQKDLKIVFTPLHGTTVKLVPASLRKWGFENISTVPEQDVVSGDFPTVHSANPEEPAALKMAIDKAKEKDAELVMACDPDGDRLGVAVKDDEDKWLLLNGNQTAILFTWYIIHQYKEQNRLKGGEYTVKTIVTSELIKDIAEQNDITCYDVYTGFKWIAAKIRETDENKYIGGGEESFGYMPGSFTRDKDAVSACSMMAEIAAWAKDKGMTVFSLLLEIYKKYGFSKEKMIYIVKEGLSGAEEIEKMMSNFRNCPPKTINSKKVITIKDYLSLEQKNISEGTNCKLDFSTTSNVLQFFLEDGSKISVRPSGTEPKIKFYFEIREHLNNISEYKEADQKAENKINNIINELNLR